jgi:hypothetical protein
MITAIIFTRYSTTSFIGHFFILRSNQPSISCIRVLPNGSAEAYYTLDSQLFLQLQLLSHKQTLSILLHTWFSTVSSDWAHLTGKVDVTQSLTRRRVLQRQTERVEHVGGALRGTTLVIITGPGEIKKITALKLPTVRPSLWQSKIFMVYLVKLSENRTLQRQEFLIVKICGAV